MALLWSAHAPQNTHVQTHTTYLLVPCPVKANTAENNSLLHPLYVVKLLLLEPNKAQMPNIRRNLSE